MRNILITFTLGFIFFTGAFAFWTGTVQDQIISLDDNLQGWYTRMAADSEGNIHVVWNEKIINFPTQNEIHYSRTADNGITWSAISQDIVISYNDGMDAYHHSDIAIDSDDNIYVVWPEDDVDVREIHCTISHDGGDSWTGQSADHILSYPGGNDALNPSIAVDQNDVIHVVWNQDYPQGSPDEIYYSRSEDGGLSWTSQTSEQIISYPDGQTSGYPEIAVGIDNELYVIWSEADDIQTDRDVVNVSISTDGGDTWSGTATDSPITQSFRILSYPRVIVDANGIVHSIWKGTQDLASPFHYEVYHSRSVDNGTTWSGMAEEKMISFRPPEDPSANIPNIGIDSQGNVIAVWDEDHIGDDNEIMISISTDGGLNWSGESQDEIISFPDGHPAYRPFIVAGTDDEFHVTWNEVTNTSYYQIHYSHGDAITEPTGLMVTLIPETLPIQIPASGGSFDFNIEVENTDPTPVTIDIWTMVTLPNGSEYGPIIDFPNFNAPGNWSGNRDRIQDVPASAPSGNYTYDAYVGIYPSTVWAEDHFGFEKLASNDSGSIISNWDNRGENFENLNHTEITLIPEIFAFITAYPNPFNPVTSLAFNLSEASDVSLKVFDIQGRAVADLVNGFRTAGVYEVSFDGSGLSSGFYFVRLHAGKHHVVKKMLLLK